MIPDVSELPLIEMVRPMPGFPDRRTFALVELDEGVLFALRSVEDPDLRFLVVAPAPFFPDYAPEVDDDTVAALGLASADEALVLLVLTAGESLQSTTANLVAPVVVNTTNRKAAQLILDDSRLTLAAPLVA